MQTAFFIVDGNECYYEITEMLEMELKKNYARKIIDGILFFVEDYSVMTSSDLLVVIRVQKMQGSQNNCEIEVIAGGGGEGIFSFGFGNEKRRLNWIFELISEFCDAKKFRITYPS